MVFQLHGAMQEALATLDRLEEHSKGLQVSALVSGTYVARKTWIPYKKTYNNFHKELQVANKKRTISKQSSSHWELFLKI